MTKLLFYLKESLLAPTSFFEHQNENPSIIHIHWIIIPATIFIVASFLHWASNSIILNELELDFFEKLFVVHMDHPFFGFGLTLFLWFRAWIPLRYFGKIDKRTSEINAWCITPYMVILFVLLFIFVIYSPIFVKIEDIQLKSGPSITSVQHGTTLLRLAFFYRTCGAYP
jgi:uncharacterized membrane protein YGL010W